MDLPECSQFSASVWVLGLQWSNPKKMNFCQTETLGFDLIDLVKASSNLPSDLKTLKEKCPTTPLQILACRLLVLVSGFWFLVFWTAVETLKMNFPANHCPDLSDFSFLGFALKRRVVLWRNYLCVVNFYPTHAKP